jgi:hypothetical protein
MLDTISLWWCPCVGGQATSNPQAALLANGTAPAGNTRNASYNSLAGATSAADVEERVAAEMRASKAEMEAASLRQQVRDALLFRDVVGHC